MINCDTKCSTEYGIYLSMLLLDREKTLSFIVNCGTKTYKLLVAR